MRDNLREPRSVQLRGGVAELRYRRSEPCGDRLTPRRGVLNEPWLYLVAVNGTIIDRWPPLLFD